MSYKENPKTKGSGIICAIPQTGRCPQECDDCFFQSDRGYLDIEKDLPNIPKLNDTINRVVRMNDGNDSNVNRLLVTRIAQRFPMKFYNTSIPNRLGVYDAPVVLTINPGKMTDWQWWEVPDPIPKNLMFVRIRTNMWNFGKVVKPAVEYYTSREIPVVLTFMAYYDTADKIPLYCRDSYRFRKRTTNEYFAITTSAWELVMNYFRHNKWVDSCGKIEGELGDTHCRFCGNCLREYFATMERMRK